MPAEWRIDLYSRARAKVAIIESYTSLTVEQRVNAPGGCTLPIWFDSEQQGVNPAVAHFETYGVIDLWRVDYAFGIPWYREKACLIYDHLKTIDAEGYSQYLVTGLGLLAMLDRTIDYYAGSPQASKSGPADSVMAEFVLENAGALATIANGRRRNGVIPALVIAPTAGTGATWEGARAGQPLIEVLQEIAAFSGVDFDIEFVVPSDTSIVPYFEFRTYIGQRGVNRSNSGIDSLTGLNSAGEVPIIFAPNRDNMAVPRYALPHSGEKNSVTVLGQGTGALRAYEVVTLGTFSGDGLDIHEATRDARNESTSPALIAVGDAVLEKFQVPETFDFQPLQLPQCAYGLVAPAFNLGRFYHWGDRVVARAYGIERIKRIMGVKAIVAPAEGGLIETLDFTMQDVSLPHNPIVQVAQDHGDRIRHLENLESSGASASTIVITGTHAARPAASDDGRLYLPNNGIYIARDSGIAWANWGPIYPLTQPILANFTWVNQGGATADDTHGDITIKAPMGTVGDSLRMLAITAPAAPWTLTVGMIPLVRRAPYPYPFIGIRQATGVNTGRIRTMGPSLAQGSIAKFDIYSWSGPTTYVGPTIFEEEIAAPLPIWWRISDDGANRHFYAGTVKHTFANELYTETNTTYVTSEQLVIGMNAGQALYDQYCAFISFELT